MSRKEILLEFPNRPQLIKLGRFLEYFVDLLVRPIH
jgi:hypothetical protein